ncbi:DUF1775 domain-containing protein [Actinoplanes sp. NPDC049316]|uniref:DUF1775 domain-containing protein n=1 Tax=Actinoplanes sp. NPDC049316 TaxID=3154727 RepID=UPI00341B7FC6
MSRLEKHRRAGVLAATVAAGVLGFAAPAAADVTVSPPSVPQGSGQNLAFTVTNTAASSITRLKLVLPPDLPVAEVYPLSVDDWAPQIENRKVDAPLTPIHGGDPVTETAASITWIAMPGKALPPGESADLTVAMGPMPTTGSRMSFTVQPTYADPAKGVPMPPVALTLTPAAPGQEAAGHSAHGTTGAEGTSDADAATFAALAAAADDGPGFWTIGGWVVAGLALAAGAVAVLRSRRRPAAEPQTGEQDEHEAKELATAGAPRVTAWSYRDGPQE